jgi:hypothetical protein
MGWVRRRGGRGLLAGEVRSKQQCDKAGEGGDLLPYRALLCARGRALLCARGRALLCARGRAVLRTRMRWLRARGRAGAVAESRVPRGCAPPRQGARGFRTET